MFLMVISCGPSLVAYSGPENTFSTHWIWLAAHWPLRTSVSPPVKAALGIEWQRVAVHSLRIEHYIAIALGPLVEAAAHHVPRADLGDELLAPVEWDVQLALCGHISLFFSKYGLLSLNLAHLHWDTTAVHRHRPGQPKRYRADSNWRVCMRPGWWCRSASGDLWAKNRAAINTYIRAWGVDARFERRFLCPLQQSASSVEVAVVNERIA